MPPRVKFVVCSLSIVLGATLMSGRGIESECYGNILGACIMSDRGIKSLASLHHDGCVAFGSWPLVRGLWCVA